MEIKNINLNRLINGLEQMGQLESSNFHLNYAVGKNLNKLGTLVKSYNKSLSALINKHVQMDEKGKPVIIGNEYDYKSKKDRDAYIKSKTELDDIKSEVDLWKLKTSDLKDVKGITGVMLFMLNDIIIDDSNILDNDESEKNESGNSVPKKSEVESN